MRIAVAGTGYVGLNVALLLSRRNSIKALDIVLEEMELLRRGESLIRDVENERFLANQREMGLSFEATTDVEEAYGEVEFAVIVAPTNYDADTDSFDTSAVEAAMEAVRSVNQRRLDRREVHHLRGLHREDQG